MTARGKRTLKSKLVQIIVTTLLTTGVVLLVAVAWANTIIERQRLEDIQRQIEETISSKAVTLATSHALALKGLVSDNAFSDVGQLVSSAVDRDADVVYGLFVGVDGRPWAYVSPSHPSSQEGEISEDAIASLKLDKHALSKKSQLAQRTVQAFGQEIHECAAPVVSDDGERLGTVVYGFSNQRTLAAVAAASERSRRALGRAFLTAGLIGFLSLLAGIAWVVRSAARITEPVAELTAAANEIAGGKRGVRVHIGSGDEVETLAASFNHMLQVNEDAMHKLEITTERALAADRLKSEFLANMSHEIRTPMNGVLGMIQLVRSVPLDGKLRRYVETIDASANALLTIINDILDFSKMEAGKYTIQSVPFEARTIVQEVAELLASRAHDKGIELIHRTARDFPALVVGDPDRFRQILNNLVGNAVKFTERGEVFIDVNVASRSDDRVVARVAVHDTGIGIDSKDLPKLYQAFSQADGTMVRRHGGTGLGLAICKRLINMMGGDIEVTSKVGQGTVFTFTLDLAVAQETKASGLDLPASPGYRVLVVDANRRWREVIEEHLLAWQMEAQSTDSGVRALERLRQAEAAHRPFDAAVISAEIADVPAVELVHMIRAEEAFLRLPLILLTSLPASSTLSEIEAELVGQLHKPLRFSELYNCLTGTLSAGKQPMAAQRSKPPIAASQKQILIVDDNDINRFVVTEELEQRGFRTDEACDGEQALRKFKSGDYLCVLMDCQMPVMDGYAATRAIREFEAEQRRPRTPVIALTAHALVGERERVLAAGMDDFLSKPFRPTSLEKLLKLHIKEPPKSEPAQASPDLDPRAKRSEKLIRLFRDRSPEQLEELERAVAKKSAADVRALSHKIKGSCLAIAAEPMSRTAELMQHHAEAGELAEAALRLKELRRQHQLVAALLGRELGKFEASSPA